MTKKGNDNSYRKVKIPKAIREQCWIESMGKNFEHKCYIPWCKNIITVFDFHVGHDIPESDLCRKGRGDAEAKGERDRGWLG